MADDLRLVVVTPQRPVVDARVEEVQLPSVLGALGVLPGHTPLLAALGIGELCYRSRGVQAAATLVVSGGFAEVLPDQVTVLADLVERPDEIDLEAAVSERERTETAMKTTDSEGLEGLAARLRLAQTRIAVAGVARR